MIIGKIVKSNSHADYVCQIFNRSETEEAPGPDDHAFGRFVRVPCDDGRWIVGLIYNTVLLNPEYGNLGPRLSSEPQLQVFSPDYLNETATLVGIAGVGMLMANEAGQVRATHRVPGISPAVGASVETMDDEDVANFHRDENRVLVGYFPRLLEQQNPNVPDLLIRVVERLEEAFPKHAGMLSVLRNNLAWDATVGGRR